MNKIDTLLERNRTWAARVVDKDAEFFERLSKVQAPQYLWIGCSDSRVPANQIVDLEPGEVFVHRNVANLVVHTDLNCLSVVQFAVDHLKVRHIMVVGHYGCGGVNAVLSGGGYGLCDHWLRHLEDVHHIHRRRLRHICNPRERSERLSELNVVEQVCHVAQLPTVRDAWRHGQPLAVHGLVYGLRDGVLRNLGATIDSDVDLGEWRRRALISLWRDAPSRAAAAQDDGADVAAD